MKIENVRQERNFDLIWVFSVRSFDRSGGLFRQKHKDFRVSKPFIHILFNFTSFFTSYLLLVLYFITMTVGVFLFALSFELYILIYIYVLWSKFYLSPLFPSNHHQRFRNIYTKEYKCLCE